MVSDFYSLLLDLNVSKCASVSFLRKTHPFVFDYSIENHLLCKLNEIYDLGVIIDCRSKDFIVRRAYRLLGFITKMTRDFTNTTCITFLYNSLVRNILEYGSQIWSPYFRCYPEQIEKIQRKFTLSLYFKSNISREDYIPQPSRLGMLSLESRRLLKTSMFLYNIVNNAITNYYCYSVWRVRSHNTRSLAPFSLPQSRSRIGYHVNTRMAASHNRWFWTVAIRDVPIISFKRTIYIIITNLLLVSTQYYRTQLNRGVSY